MPVFPAFDENSISNDAPAAPTSLERCPKITKMKHKWISSLFQKIWRTMTYILLIIIS
jgi:hypothetical protein